MDSKDNKAMSGKKGLQVEVAANNSDPNFYGALRMLPNPDVILRKLGRSQEVFDAIMADPHVMGERRSTRSALLGYEYRLQPGGESPADIRAYELGLEIMARAPVPGMQWADAFWNMAQAVYRGFRVHEVVWEKRDGLFLPAKVLDRPGRRFLFDHDGQLRVKTKAHPQEGEVCLDKKWLLTRHMPSAENPYGEALLSSCYWPYIFKHGGMKFFYKFCEKFGIPWVKIEMPSGATKDQIKEAADLAASMIEDAVAAFPQGGQADLVQAASGMSKLPQERLIQLCNKEMSKCLTSQTLSSEMDGEGSRAAAETHRGREKDVNETDRDLICYTMNDLLRWATEINVANAAPPTFEFYEEEEARKEWVEVFKDARDFMPIPLSFAQQRLQIPAPKEGEEVLLPSTPKQPTKPQPTAEFNAAKQALEFPDTGDELDPLTEQATTEAEQIIADMAAPIRELLGNVNDLHEFRAELLKMYPMIDDSRLAELNAQVLQVGILTGMRDA